MTERALPCVICGTALCNVWDEAENQPDGGVVAIIEGCYGSTAFDSFDGTHLEITVCDPCLVQAGREGRVLSGRRRKPVTLQDLVVGYEEVNTPLVPWHEGLPGYENSSLALDGDEDLARLPARVHIDLAAWSSARKLLGIER